MERKLLIRYLLVAIISFTLGFSASRILTNTTASKPLSVEVTTDFDSNKEESKEDLSLSNDNISSPIWKYKNSTVSIQKCYINEKGDYIIELLMSNQHADEMIAYFEDTYVNDMQTGCYRTGDYIIKGKQGIMICKITKDDLLSFNINEVKTIDTKLCVECDDQEYIQMIHIDPSVFK